MGFVDNEAVELALIGTAPTPAGLPAGGGVEASWWSRNMGGMFREACDRNGLYNYTPLYALKKVRQKHLLRRESPVPDPEDDDLWVFEIVLSMVNKLIKLFFSFIFRWTDVQAPWDPLDEDGEEEAFDGSVSVIYFYFLSLHR